MNPPIEPSQRRSVWPPWWYLVVLLSVFVYLLPVWVDSIVPPAVYDLSYTIDSPAYVGQFATAHIVRCSSAKDPQVYYFVRTFVSDKDSSGVITSSGNGIAVNGCHNVTALIGPIPDGTRPGNYQLISVLVNQGLFRLNTTPYISTPFRVEN